MISIVNFTKRRVPRIMWERIAHKVLGSKFELSIAFVGEARMRSIKKKYPPVDSKRKGKDNKATNTLSFLIDKDVGEIFLCPAYIEREASSFNRLYRAHFLTLFIHSLLHLKGFGHHDKKSAGKMAKKEYKILELVTK